MRVILVYVTFGLFDSALLVKKKEEKMNEVFDISKKFHLLCELHYALLSILYRVNSYPFFRIYNIKLIAIFKVNG